MRFPFFVAGFFAVISVLSGCQMAPYGHSVAYGTTPNQPEQVVMPADAPTISNQFSQPDNYSRVAEKEHLGLDVFAPVGTPVLAASRGTVRKSFYGPMYGHQIIVDHGKDEKGAEVTTIYKHLDERQVEAGETIRRGQPIGTLGTTGVLSQVYPHLHFELWRREPGKYQEPVDPQFHWVNGVGKVTCFRRGKYYRASRGKLTFPVICKGA